MLIKLFVGCDSNNSSTRRNNSVHAQEIMAKINDFIDPRLTVFVFWVFFLLAFRCLPIKRFIGKVFRMMGCSCCDDLITIDEETNRDGNARNIIEYQQLSDERKTEIDGNRSEAILGYLNGFSLVSCFHFLFLASIASSTLAMSY